MTRWLVFWSGTYFAHGIFEAVDEKDAAMRMMRSQEKDLRVGDQIIVVPDKRVTRFQAERVGAVELIEVKS